MFWVVYAIAAHVGNAAVFVIDRGLLGSNSPMSNVTRYAAYSGLVAALTAIVLVFSFAVPTPAAATISIIGGVLWVAALWFFFYALKHGDSARVVPIAGSSVPLFTLLFAITFLGEQLSVRQFVAVFLLIAGGVLLSIKLQSKALPVPVLASAVVSGAFFAGHFTLIDYLYTIFNPFLAAFAYSRIGVGMAAFVLLLLVVMHGKQGQRHQARRTQRSGWAVTSVFFSNKLLGAGALILQNYAISLGSVTIVNALQGVQYVGVLVLAFAVAQWWPKLYREEAQRVALWQKLAGIVLISVGLVALF